MTGVELLKKLVPLVPPTYANLTRFHGVFAPTSRLRDTVVPPPPAFVEWYNTVHLHSGIRFVTPDDRHDGRNADILARRGRVYEAARAQHRARWAGKARNWVPVGQVVLNPIQQIPASHRQPHTKQAGLEPLAA